MIVTDKTQFYQLYQAGAFGNKLRSWENVDDIKRSGYKGEVTIRCSDRFGGAQVRYGVLVADIYDVCRSVLAISPALCQFNEAAPDQHLLVQGELMRSVYGLTLNYSRAKMGMRRAMSERREPALHGLEALHLLRRSLCPNSFSDLEALLDLYPESVIEFGSYSVSLGLIPGRNTVIWEVRNY